MKKIKKEVNIEYFEDTDSGSIKLVDIKPGDISSTALFKIEETGVILYVNMDINNRILGFEIDGMGLSISRSIKDELDKTQDS